MISPNGVKRQIKAILEVIDERTHQDQVWGEQNHRSVPGAGGRVDLGIAPEDLAKSETDAAAQSGELTWAHLAIEELSEAIWADDDVVRRRELVQLAAVAIAWIECIDRRASATPPRQLDYRLMVEAVRSLS